MRYMKALTLQKEVEAPKFAPKFDYTALTEVEQRVLQIISRANSAVGIYDVYIGFVMLKYAMFYLRLDKKINRFNEDTGVIEKFCMKFFDKTYPHNTDVWRQLEHDLEKHGDFNKLAQYYNRLGAGIPAYNTVRKTCLDFAHIGWLQERQLTKRKFAYFVPDEIKSVILKYPIA